MKTVELTIEKLVAEGHALGRWEGLVVFVEGALPGERVRAEWVKRKRSFAFARTVEVLEPSPDRVEPSCPVFGACGGCAFLHCAYPAQLRFKEAVVREQLRAFPAEVFRPIRGMETPWDYRNKMVYTFGTDEQGPVLGMHRRGDFRRVVSAASCRLQSAGAREALARTLDFVRAGGLSIFDERRKTGLLRELLVREGKRTGRRLIQLNATGPVPGIERLADAYGDLCDTLLVGVDRRVHGPPRPEQVRTVTGEGRIDETLNGLRFLIGPETFFQTNTAQAEHLFKAVIDGVAETHPHTALDLYAGTGPIAMHLARAADEVYAVESSQASVADARENLRNNGIENVYMLCEEVERMPPALWPTSVDALVVDPPRAGLHPKALQRMLRAQPKTLMYVSCNPATLARDADVLFEHGYRVDVVQPVDMFPHTFHLECVARFRAPRA